MAVPSIRDLIPRTSVVEALSSAILRHRLTLVQGPAGYGKTSAAALAVGALRLPTAWYTAQPWHGGAFVEPLVAEVRRAREDFGRVTLALANHGRPADDDAEQLRLWALRVGASFSQELGHLRDRLVIVIEDYHLLEGDLAFSDFIIGAMRQLPETISLVLIGRSTPTLPIAEWTAQGRAIQFGAEDLKFNAVETLLLAHKHGVDIDEARATELCSRCEGWPIGISLLVGARAQARAGGDASREPAASQLVEGHLATLPFELVDFLERTAALEVLDVSLLEQYGTIADARRLLKELGRRGEMLTVLRAGETYRLHPIAREALIERVRDRAGALGVARLHAWAGAMLEAAGRHAPALFHLERANDPDRLVRFISANVDALFADGHGEQVARAVRELAKRGVDEPVLVGRIQGMLMRQRGLPGAQQLFRTALEVAAQRNDADAMYALRVLLLHEALDRLDPAAASEVGSLAREADVLGTHQKATALILLGWTRCIETDFASARELAAAAGELGVASAELRFRAALLYAYAATCLGEFSPADAAMSDLLRDLESSEHVVLLCYTLFWYARLSLMWGDVRAAADYARQGATLGRHLNLHAELASVYDVLAEIDAGAGDRARCVEAEEIVAEHASAAWYSADRERLAQHARQMFARCEFVGGSVPGALQTVRAALATASSTQALRAGMKADEALYKVFSQPLDLLKAAKAAEDAIATAVPFDVVDAALLASAQSTLLFMYTAAGVDAPARLIELPAAKSFHKFMASRARVIGTQHVESALRRAAAADNVADDATTALAAAYEHLKARGFGFEAAAVAALARRFAQSATHAPAAFGAKQFVFAGAATVQTVAINPRGATLTKRESEVLSLVALGLTNKEIAQRLHLSRRTVETHVERVLAKLNAASRTRAVAEAIRAGMLSAAAWSGTEEASSA